MLGGGIALLGPGTNTSQDSSNPEHRQRLAEGIGRGVRDPYPSGLTIHLNVLLLTGNACMSSSEQYDSAVSTCSRYIKKSTELQ